MNTQKIKNSLHTTAWIMMLLGTLAILVGMAVSVFALWSGANDVMMWSAVSMLGYGFLVSMVGHSLAWVTSL